MITIHITRIETFRMKEHPRELIVQIHTNEGIIGLGETNAKVAPVEEMIHTFCADLLIGQNPLHIERIWSMFYQTFNHHGCSGTEMRALSAIDIALWDIMGKIANQPVYQLLGGASRNKVNVYNTCVGYMQNNDRDRFITEPEKLAEELLNRGIKTMKIWPFDELSRHYNGHYITPDLLKEGTNSFRKIRQEFGDAIELAIEGHGRWNLPSAIRIAKELEQYNILWQEDMVPINNPKVLSQLREKRIIRI